MPMPSTNPANALPLPAEQRPVPGDEVFMRFDDGAQITIGTVPSHQPHKAEGVWLIRDQYGSEHGICRDGDSWVTTEIPDTEDKP